MKGKWIFSLAEPDGFVPEQVEREIESILDRRHRKEKLAMTEKALGFADDHLEFFDEEDLSEKQDSVIQARRNLEIAKMHFYEIDVKYRFAQLADEAANATHLFGKFPNLQKNHVYKMIGALLNLECAEHAYSTAIHGGSVLSWIRTPGQILELANEYFFPSGLMATSLTERKQAGVHVVINGHGCFDRRVEDIDVPAGKFLHFYCHHGQPLEEALSHHIEGCSPTSPLTIPLQTIDGGKPITNYFLAYPSGITINVEGWGGLDYMIINRDPKRMIPLSKIFERIMNDKRFRDAVHIHWCACRKNKTRKFKLLPGPYLEMKEKKDPGHWGAYWEKESLAGKVQIQTL